jgi:DNA modification methylase
MRLILGDCLEVLKTLPDESVHCCITSPPYYGLRDYGTAKWEGGEPGCNHSPRVNGRGALLQGGDTAGLRDKPFNVCPKCGAVRIDAQLGLEKTPEEYVAKLVEVFREVRRVLRDDGTLWLNLGDSYASSQSTNGGYSDKSTLAGFSRPDTKGRQANESGERHKIEHGLKPKDLIGIPWRVAFALQADGWYLRQDLIWAKPNPMPESVTDRCTKSYEYIFLLAKSQKYFYDAEAIAEPATPSSTARWNQDIDGQARSDRVPGKTNGKMRAVGGPRVHGNIPGRDDGGAACNKPDQFTRNRRSVWTITTKPFKEAHFATFPPDLVEPMIKAGCPVGGTVLDPFAGAGTTGLVAAKLDRDFLGIELNPDYIAIAERRIKEVQSQGKLFG